MENLAKTLGPSPGRGDQGGRGWGKKTKINDLEPKLAPRSFISSTDMFQTTVRPFPTNLQHCKVRNMSA